MPQTPDWAKYLSAGVEFVAMTQTEARTRAKELVSQGHLAQSQVQGFVDDLVDESRRRSDSIVDVVRQEIGRQVKTLGIATREDLARLEAKLSRITFGGSSTPRAATTATPAKKSATKRAAKKTAAKKSPAKKAAAKQTVAKKSTATSTGVKKTAAKKTAAKKSPAKKSPAKKSPAKKSPAKKTTAKQTAPAARAS